MRSDAAIACCRLALTRDSFLIGPYISSSAARNDVNSPAVSRPCGNLAAAVPQRAGNGDAAQELHQRRQHRQHARHLQVGAEQRRRGALELGRLAALGAERLDDAVAGEGFAGDVRHVLLRLLAPARHGAHALAEADDRIDHQRRRGHADQRQLGVVVEQQRRRSPTSVSDSRARSPIVSDTARCTRPTSLLMRDSNCPAVRAREERRRLIQHVAEQLVAHHHHDAVAEALHQVAREVRAQSLEQVDDQDRRGDRRQVRPASSARRR